MACGRAPMILSAVMLVTVWLMRTGDCDFISDEEKLRSDLLGNYTVYVRPAFKTDVFIQGLIASLNYLDIALQSMSISMMFDVIWYDSRLTWNATDRGGLEALVIAPEAIWTPPIVVENAVAKLGVMGGKDRDATPLRVTSDGRIHWYPIMEVTTSCEMKIGQYPFDTQVCFLKLSGWTFPLSELNITAGDVNDNIHYSPNGEFDLLKTRSYIKQIGGDTEDRIYRNIYFEFTWRRKWQFYGQNMLVPIVLNSILMAAVFGLPIESGEKMGYCLTVLLSYTVFLTWVTERLPPVSNDSSILQVYLAVVLCLGCLATIMTIWVLHVYHLPPDKTMNLCYRKFASLVLIPFNRLTLCNKNKHIQVHFQTQGERTNQVIPLRLRSVGVEQPPTPKSISRNENNLQNDVELDKNAESGENGRDTTPVCSWPELAALMDHFFLWLFGFSLVILTAMCLSLLNFRY